MNILALGYIGFRSPRYEEFKEFGPEILGLQLMSDASDGGVRLRLDDRHHRLNIHPGERDEVGYLGWELRGREEFEAALLHLENKGHKAVLATPDERSDRRVANMAWLMDPAGFRHEIFYGQGHEQIPFHPGRPLNGFVAGHLGLGHCVMVVPELTPEIHYFATEVLCFKTYWPLAHIEIYRCNARSHCLLYLPIPGHHGMEHFYLHLKHLDDVGRAYDKCRDLGIIVKELGRYAQDDDVSFYMRSPAGVDIQYATGWVPSEKDAIDKANQGIVGMPPNSLVWGHHRLIPEHGSMMRRIEG